MTLLRCDKHEPIEVRIKRLERNWQSDGSCLLVLLIKRQHAAIIRDISNGYTQEVTVRMELRFLINADAEGYSVSEETDDEFFAVSIRTAGMTMTRDAEMRAFIGEEFIEQLEQTK